MQEEIRQKLIDLNDSRVNEILGFGFGLEVGKWYKKNDYGDLMFYFNGKYTYKDNENNYGFDYNGFFQKEIGVHKREVNKYYEATHEEVEQALIKEAKRRGLVNIGQISIYKPFSENKSSKGYFKTSHNFYKFNPYDNTLRLDGVRVFENGVWAEIIDDKAELKQEIEDLENKLKELREKL